MRLRFLVLMAGLVLMCAGITTGLAHGAGASALDVSLVVEKPSVSGSDAVIVQAIFTNQINEDLAILKWHTPFRSLDYDMFIVERDGMPVPYQGPVFKHGRIRSSDFIMLRPGEARTAAVDISKGYNTSLPGHYSVRLRTTVPRAGSSIKSLGQRLDAGTIIQSGVVYFEITSAGKPRVSWLEALAAAAPVFEGCSDEEKAQLNDALSAAQAASKAAHEYLRDLPEADRPTDDRYKTWFGDYTAGRYATAEGNLDKIQDALNNKTITFRCDPTPECEPGDIAYTFPDDPYRIYLCDGFWSSGVTGFDSQMGVLVHEVSHFTAVAGTDDHAYGTTDCKALAVNDPDTAVDNADTYEYFVESGDSSGVVTHQSIPSSSLPGQIILLLLLIAAATIVLRRRAANTAA